MTLEEQDVWAYILNNRQALPEEVADACGVERSLVERLISKIGTPEEVWRNPPPATKPSALERQEGGSHYQKMAVQPWQVMEAWLTPEEYRGYHKGVAIAYLARERQKGGDGDIKKAIHHLQRLVETWEKK